MPPDGAFLHSNDPLLRHPNRPAGQYDLPSFSAQESAYTLDSGHAYPRDMPTRRMLPPTMDPSRLLHRQSPMPAAQAESASESEAEMDDGGEPDPGWDWRLVRDDAAGWANHPDTIGLGNPHFYATKTKGDMRDAAGVQVPVLIHARFVLKKRAARQRNFWILYRRNYFGVQGSYHLEPLPGSSPKETLYLHRKNHKPKPIQALFMCMRGVVETEEGPEIKIVVFNAKRKPLHEGQDPPPIEPQRMKPLTEGSTKYYVESTGDRQDHMDVPMNHTFHRNQFRAATQNNGARRTEQQFYHILLELKAEIMVEESRNCLQLPQGCQNGSSCEVDAPCPSKPKMRRTVTPAIPTAKEENLRGPGLEMEAESLHLCIARKKDKQREQAVVPATRPVAAADGPLELPPIFQALHTGLGAAARIQTLRV